MRWGTVEAPNGGETLVRIGVLGPLRVTAGGAEVPIASAFQRRIMTYLAADPGQVVTVDRLILALWGDRPPERPEMAVRVHVSRLRRAVRALDPGNEAIVTDPLGYALGMPPESVDAVAFERTVGAGRALVADRPDEAVAQLEAALSMWRGRAFEEYADDEALAPLAVRLEEMRLAAAESRFDGMLALGHHESAVADLERHVAEHPLRERPVRQLMTALYRSGRAAEALDLARAARVRFTDELGIETTVELRDLETAILRNDPALTPPGPPAVLRSMVPVVPDLVGRDADLADVVAALSSSRVVTLIGPGGVGKTTLAAAAARAQAAPVWWCNLSVAQRSQDVGHVVADAIGLRASRQDDVLDAVVAALATRAGLLVLDCCEHVLDAAGELAAHVAQRCDHVVVLATSRERLDVPLEDVHPTLPLPVVVDEQLPQEAAAVGLFMQRAGRRLAADAGSLALVRSICARLDGLPLAIELAASRSRATSLAELDGELAASPLGLSSRRAAEPRHATLEAVVGWSYELAGPAERALFDRLSVFSGRFSAEAAGAVCGGAGVDPAGVPAMLGRLADRSLIDADTSGAVARFSLLRTMSAFAAVRLEASGESAVWEVRHAEYMLGFAERQALRIRGREERDAVPLLDTAVGDLRAAHARAVGSGRTEMALRLSVALHDWAVHRARPEPFAWAEAAVGLPDAVIRAAYRDVVGIVAHGMSNRGDLRGARRLAEDAMGGDAAIRPSLRALTAAAAVALYEGRLDDTLLIASRWLDLASAQQDRYDAIFARVHIVLAHSYAGRHVDADALSVLCLREAEAFGNPCMLAWATYTRGEVLRPLEPLRSLAFLDRAIHLARAVDARYPESVARLSAATTRARHGHGLQAREFLAETVRGWRDSGDWTHQWPTLRCVAEVLVREEQLEAACTLLSGTQKHGHGSLYGEDARRIDQMIPVLRERLGAARFVHAWTTGEQLTQDELVVIALDALV